MGCFNPHLQSLYNEIGKAKVMPLAGCQYSSESLFRAIKTSVEKSLEINNALHNDM